MRSIRVAVIVGIAVAAVLGGMAWYSQVQRAPAPAESSAPPEQQSAPPASEAPGSGSSMDGQDIAPPPADLKPGLTWKIPANWSMREARPMRLATYGIPALSGDSTGAECAVFYFGAGQGGDAESNMDRWIAQFQHPGQPERARTEVGGLTVWRLRVSGDYLAPSGPQMESSGLQHDWELLAAIVNGPNGSVFFKLTGPRRTVEGNKHEFEDLLKTLKQSS
jgi:hypothetical protein